ncbi:MAG: response regulator [Magnetococcus sp. YQC-3]
MLESGQLLIVEDSAVQRVMLQRLLRNAGYTLLVAKDGVEGLAQARAHRPALVITDIAMPNMDGYAMCRAIKDDPQLAEIPVMLLTGLDDPREVIRGLEAGADNYLTKPVEDAHLLERIHCLLHLPAEQRESTGTSAPQSPDEELTEEEGLQVSFAGEVHLIRASRRQTMNLLLSTYENAVRKNRELIQAKQALSLLTDHLEQEVLRRTRQLEVANRVKTEFISNMSHEVRTPMNAIIGMTDLVLGLELPPQQREMLTIARTAADNLLRLLNSLLDFSRLEEGKLEVSLDMFALRGMLRDLAEPFLRQAEAKGLSFCCRIAPGLPDSLIGDALRIRQVLEKLLDNALKFTEQGTICLEVTAGSSITDTAEEPVALLFSVVDSGIGIEAEQKEWIFESFTQGDGSRTRKYGGSGLGLSLAKRLTEALGGQLSFRSERGSGSTFCLQVAFPYDPTSMEQEEAADGGWVTLLQTEAKVAADGGNASQAGGGELDEHALLAECHRLLSLCEEAIQTGRMGDVERWITPLKQVGMQFLSHEGDDAESFSGTVLRMAIAARNADSQKALLHLDQARASLTA